MTPLLHFVLFALVSTPANFVWQQALEARFPGARARNTLAKFAADQALAAPANTALFLAAMGWLHGAPDVRAHVAAHFWPLVRAGLAVWPPASLLAFALVPVQRRVLFGSAVALAWNVWLGVSMRAPAA